MIGLLGFKLVSDGEQLVRVALPYLTTIYIVAMMLLRMGYSSTKGCSNGVAVNHVGQCRVEHGFSSG